MVTVDELQKQISVLLEQIAALQGPVMVNNKPIDSTIRDNREEYNILLDSSFLIAVLIETDIHHLSALSALGFLKPYKPTFYVPFLVLLETMGKIIRINEWPVAKAEKIINNCLGKILNARCDKAIDYGMIMKKYHRYARKAIKNLTGVDFYIVVTGIELSAKILTCDLGMYNNTHKSYKDVYFISDKNDKKSSDFPKLMKDIVKGYNKGEPSDQELKNKK